MTSLVLIARHFDVDAKLTEVTAFFKKHPVPAAERALARVKENIQASISWKKENVVKVCSWLKRNV